MNNNYSTIVQHYEQCFVQHGDNHKGVDWPNEADLEKRFQVATQLFRNQNTPFSLLDFGCGNGLFIDYLTRHEKIKTINYTGLDLSSLLIDCSRKKYPHLSFIHSDVLQDKSQLAMYDYIILNGVLTEKRTLDFETMWQYSQELLITLFEHCHIGLSFNVMSEQVDWKKDFLFYVKFDLLANFLRQNLSRHFIFRHDYGLYEFTTYIYKQPL